MLKGLFRRPVVTEKVLEYLVHKAQYEKAGPKEEIPDFTERIVPELALEMYVALSNSFAYLSGF
jgi:transcription elongation factor B subunit 1